jgi:hypothetical protein
MSKLTHWKTLSVATAVLLCAAVSWNLAIAQTKTGAAKAKPAAADGDDDAPAKAKGRLPPYYKDIVDAKQKDKIYAIQADFNTKIDALEDQLKKLTNDRDAAVENVLTPEQKEKLKKAKEEGAAKKKKKTPDDKPTDDKASDSKPSAKSAN